VPLAFTVPAEDEVSVRVADVGGTVGGVSDPATGVLRVNGAPQGMTVGGGTFSAQAILKSGDNMLRATVDVPDGRRGCTERTLRSTIAEATVSATLTWSDADADLDLYVTQPDGETAWFSNRTTTAGGTLDRDDTSGYGPETYSLSAAEGDTVVPGDYVVRVHYYSDHEGSEVPTRAVGWRVVAVVNEGTPGEMRVIREGVLSAENSSNSSPGSTGPDWADAATLTVPAPPPGG
jgi:uncharacterized protein YfaP (DUF2135 family)